MGGTVDLNTYAVTCAYSTYFLAYAVEVCATYGTWSCTDHYICSFVHSYADDPLAADADSKGSAAHHGTYYNCPSSPVCWASTYAAA